MSKSEANGLIDALVIGGGIGGLCAALALRQRGLKVAVYEKTAVLGRVGAGITLWSNAIRVLDKLGVGQRVRRYGSPLEQGEVCDHHGRVLTATNVAQLTKQLGVPSIAIHRADLHRAFLETLEAAGDIPVHLDKAFVRYEQSNGQLVAHFADGTTAVGQYLVGGDGLNSAVRPQMKPTVSLRYAGYTAYRGIVESATPAITQNKSFEAWGPGQRFGLVRINDRQLYWFATQNAPPAVRREPIATKKHLQVLFADWFHPVPWLIDETPAEAILHNDICDFKPQSGWSDGAVVLLGDAIHPTTPNMGQGAGMAIESAAVLADTWPEFSAYEARRAPRTAVVTTQSWRLGRVGQWENPLLTTVRTLANRLAPARLLEKQLLDILSYQTKT